MCKNKVSNVYFPVVIESPIANTNKLYLCLFNGLCKAVAKTRKKHHEGRIVENHGDHSWLRIQGLRLQIISSETFQTTEPLSSSQGPLSRALNTTPSSTTLDYTNRGREGQKGIFSG